LALRPLLGNFCCERSEAITGWSAGDCFPVEDSGRAVALLLAMTRPEALAAMELV
jgi:hypothetical protein